MFFIDKFGCLWKICKYYRESFDILKALQDLSLIEKGEQSKIYFNRPLPVPMVFDHTDSVLVAPQAGMRVTRTADQGRRLRAASANHIMAGQQGSLDRAEEYVTTNSTQQEPALLELLLPTLLC